MRSSIALMVIGVSIATYFFYISPQIDVVKSLIAQKNEYNEILNKVQEVKDKRDKLLADYNGIAAEDVEKLDKIIPNTFDSTEFIYDLHNLTAQYGLVVSSFQESLIVSNNGAIDAAGTPERYKTHLIKFNVRGQYDNLVRFLESIETSLNLVDVNQIVIKSAVDPKTKVETLNVDIDLTTYSLK